MRAAHWDWPAHWKQLRILNRINKQPLADHLYGADLRGRRTSQWVQHLSDFSPRDGRRCPQRWLTSERFQQSMKAKGSKSHYKTPPRLQGKKGPSKVASAPEVRVNQIHTSPQEMRSPHTPTPGLESQSGSDTCEIGSPLFQVNTSRRKGKGFPGEATPAFAEHRLYPWQQWIQHWKGGVVFASSARTLETADVAIKQRNRRWKHSPETEREWWLVVMSRCECGCYNICLLLRKKVKSSNKKVAFLLLHLSKGTQD